MAATPIPIRTLQDHGTVGAVVNDGSDLSYDLSSNDDHTSNGKRNNTNTNSPSKTPSSTKKKMLLPPTQVVINNDHNDDDDDDDVDDIDDNDDDVSLDDDQKQYFKGDYGIRNRKEYPMSSQEEQLSSNHQNHEISNNEVIIQDLHQLDLHGSNKSKSGEYNDYFDDDDDQDDDNQDDENNDHNDNNDDEGNENGGGGGKNVDLGLKDIANWIQSGKCQKIVVLCGAGVSCSAGIPDFRTPGSGLYDNLEKYNLPYPEAVFDLSFYQSNPLPFVSLAKEIWPGTKHSPTLSHSFISLLSSKNLLVRNYTQNIDGLELLSGVSESKIVECHGHFRTASCIACGIPYDGKECYTKIVEEDEVPTCYKCGCLVKPDIVFFGESLPVRFKKMLHSDLGCCDLLIVMGTSLKVAPVSLIPEMVNSRTPRALFNRELVGDFVPPGVDGNYRDVFVEGDCDDSVRELCSLLGWEEELLELNEKTKIDPM